MQSQNHNYIQILCLMFVCKLLMSCGAQEAQERTEPPAQDRPQFTLVSPASYYFLQDKNCETSDSAPVSINSANVFSANRTGLVNQSRNLIGASSRLSLSTPSVRETFKGGTYEANCTAEDVNDCQGRYLDVSEWDIIEDRVPLKVCREAGDYRRFSYEGMALTVAFFIQEASAAAYRYLPDMTLNPVSLEMIPKYRVRSRNVTLNGQERDVLLYATHQMSYSPSSQSILVYPERDGVPQNRPQFWESSFVISHEYGHHIERTIRSEIVSGLKKNAFKDFIDGNPDSRKGDRAISEAFADLLSYYTLNESPLALSEFERDFHDRNPRNSIFSDAKTSKIWTPEARDLFLNAPTGYDPQGKVDLRRMHLVGAIFAHGLNKIFTLFAAANAGDVAATEDASTGDKYRYAVRWFKKYSELKFEKIKQDGWQNLDSFSLVQKALDDLWSNLKRESSGFTKVSTKTQICTSYAEQFPALNILSSCL